MKNNVTVLSMAWESGIIKNVLLPTCEVVSPYCSKIIIAHCGPKDQMYLYDSYKHIKNLQIVPFDYDGFAVDVIEFLIKFVPENEWMLFLDSDHRPTNALLTNLDDSISFLNANDYQIGSFATQHHEFKDGIINYSGYPVPTTQKEVQLNNIFTVRSLCKKNENFIINHNQGFHYVFDSINHKFYYFPYGMNHYKLFFEYFSSTFLSGYSNPRVHSFSKEECKLDIINEHVYQQFEELKIKYNMPYSNDFKEKAYRNEIPQEFVDFFSNSLFLKGNNSNTTNFLDHSYSFCTKFKFSFEESFSNKRVCGKECCKYGDIQL
jgi:hypothetical protein